VADASVIDARQLTAGRNRDGENVVLLIVAIKPHGRYWAMSRTGLMVFPVAASFAARLMSAKS
jgi:hypothetical protein